jgi:CheY-like chemotaxis protein
MISAVTGLSELVGYMPHQDDPLVGGSTDGPEYRGNGCRINGQEADRDHADAPGRTTPPLPEENRDLILFSGSGRNLPDMNVLVVEDSRTQAEALRFILERVGCRVFLAEDGRDAMQKIALDRPSVILTDILMPEMDGYDLCRAIKADSVTSDIPVILVTQLYSVSDVVKGLECGADNFIIKPYEPKEIYARVFDAVQASRHKGIAGTDTLEVAMDGNVFTISSNWERIVHILLSTYEIAIRKNEELIGVQDQLGQAHALLNDTAAGLNGVNACLRDEIERSVVGERALAAANRKLQLMASITRHDLLNQLTLIGEHLGLAVGSSKRGDPDGDCKGHVREAEEILAGMMNMIEFTGSYEQIGQKPPLWFDVRPLIPVLLPETDSVTEIENRVDPGMKVYADPLFSDLFASLIKYRVRNCREITRIDFLSDAGTEGAGPRIICSDNGPMVPPDDKEAIFSFGYGLKAGLELFLARALLEISGISIRETGTIGGRFEILCPDCAASFCRPSMGTSIPP